MTRCDRQLSRLRAQLHDALQQVPPLWILTGEVESVPVFCIEAFCIDRCNGSLNRADVASSGLQGAFNEGRSLGDALSIP